MRIEINDYFLMSIVIIIGIIKSIIIFAKIKIPQKKVIYMSIFLFLINVLISIRVGTIIYHEALLKTTEYSEKSSILISLIMAIIGFLGIYNIIRLLIDVIYNKLGLNLNKK